MSWLQHYQRILALGVPLIGSLMAQIAIQFTDSIMLGRYDLEALAGQVLGGALFTVLLLFGAGFGFAVTPIVAEAEARGQFAEIRRSIRMSLWLSTGFGALALPVFLGSETLFLVAGQAPEIAALAGQYLRIAGLAIFPALGLMALRSYLSGLGHTRIQFWAMVGAVVVNALTNYALIFGNWGAPEMGIRGAAIASVISTLVACAAVALYAALATRDHRIFQHLWRADPEALAHVFRLGLPIGLAMLAEAGLFSIASVFMGWLGTNALAAHGIAMQIITLIFMGHLGLSQAATIRAGNAKGRDDAPGLIRGGLAVMSLSGALSLIAAAAFLLIPVPLIDLFLRDGDPARGEVVAIGVSLLAAAALFQTVDAAQVMAMGLLRGLQDTRVPMIYAAISYWVVGAPMALVLGFGLGMEGVGIWLGMALGLALAAVLLQTRFWRHGPGWVANGSSG
ncbi:MATE family efflux transporter [Palleronia caenipelagi]|uniref:Multidrug-efflux transporter n=1 Tax=Palleronia caenipelagi TaxID=2489174 RepID=A0A547Q730_9RHOB|nr:MATE family efflux transporter [Palleronia caenipelagi]TRD22163.1 MATE family efflux transporter [Palleronia caenipelagi]